MLTCFSREEAGEEEVVDPVSEQRRQEEKGEAATKDRNMAVVVFLSQTAVILTKRSSSHPRGVRLESPNLSAALLDLVAYGRLGLHSAAVVMSVYMLCSCKAMMLISVFQTRPPCTYSHLNIRVPLQCLFFLPSLVLYLHKGRAQLMVQQTDTGSTVFR